jgi:hypothetical protein
MELADIPARLRARNLSQASLARHLGLDPSSLVKTIKGQRKVQAAEVVAIEEFLGEPLEIGAPQHRLPRAIRAAEPRKVPVYGYAAAGGEDHVSFAEDRILEWRELPPFWSGGDDLIYVRIIGDSMEPRYFSGEIVPVRLNVPPAKGRDCLVQFYDNTVLIKTYAGMAQTTVLLRQYNPATELKIDGSKVRQLHAVWTPNLL